MILSSFQRLDASPKNLTETKLYSLIGVDEINFPQIVIFDYNDTLVDSWPIALKVFNDCLIHLGHRPMTPAEQYALPYIPDPELLSIITSKPLNKTYKIYDKFYNCHHKRPDPPIKGAVDLLTYLKEEHVDLILISNKPSKLLHKTLRQMKWDMFDSVIGAGDLSVTKPDPKVVELAIKGKKVASKEIWFVGDAYTDMQCASGSNVFPIWVKEKAKGNFILSKDGIRLFAVENLRDLLNLLKDLKKGT